MSSSKRIISSKGELSAYERWELPNMNEPKEPDPDPEELEEVPQPPTAEEIEAIRQEAYSDGQKEGYEAGYRTGMGAAQQEIATRIGHLEKLIGELAEPLRTVDEQVEDELVELVIAIAKQIIRRELHIAPDEIIRLVRDGLTALPVSARKIKVALHPDDAALVRDALHMVDGEDDEEQRWSILEDPALSRGGCHITTNHSRIDASVEKRINAVISQLLGDERATERDERDATS